MKHLLFALVVAITTTAGFTQTPWEHKRDSLFKVLAASKEDTNRLPVLLAIGTYYSANHPDSAIYYYKKIGELSDKLNYLRGKVTYRNMTAGVLCKQGKPDEAIRLDEEALAMAKASGNTKLLGRSYINMATPYKVKGDYPTALSYFQKASAIAEELKDTLVIASIAINEISLYKDLRQHDKAAEMALKGIRLSKALNNLLWVNSASVLLTSVLIEQGRYDTALVVLKDSKALSEKLNDRMNTCYALINIGDIYLETNRIDQLKENGDELLALSKTLDNKEGVSNALQQLYTYYFYKKEYKKAKAYALEALQYSRDNQLPNLVGPTYKQLSLVELLEGDFAAFKRDGDRSDSMDNLVKSQEIIKNTQELDARYSLTIKQHEIENLNKEKRIQELTLRQRRTVNWLLAGVVVFVVLFGLLFYRNNRQKRKLLLADAALQQQRIAELEKEKQLLAADAILQGQEEERTRLAKDLHDGLGSILSGAKYSFNNMKTNFVLSEESAAAFDKSMAMLDKSISELRMVSHNMMPEALMKFGLDTALKDYCNSINQTGALQLAYQSYDLHDDTIPKTTASVIYRIIQELVNNILKHAQAKTALVQLVRKDDTLSITVEDDGRGFDKSLLAQSDGIGLKNLHNRVTYLKGSIDVTADPGKGVSVNIEIPTVA